MSAATETIEKKVDTPEAENLDEDIETLRRRVQEMEEEDEKLRKIQEQLSAEEGSSANKEDEDTRSVYVGNVDYSTTAAELQQHFNSCGSINRTTIFCDRLGHPKGFAYLEFTDKDSVSNALLLNETTFKNRQIKVEPKRANVPGMSTTDRGRGRGRGGFRGRFMRGRGRGRGGFHPYSTAPNKSE
ncbi:polyadenylate-binding protein 2-like [Planoprotostelium fungivorum]|uniref:Polyadenylate-binding protein 2-like n=1 Tax=Planoprotostelium fungivorum TaxID=1890364 RepID=A0A2P6NLI7_9EUKA|nr:polyadenylate-binding protein 2-like [Planoprotostelium fungivorum]